VISRPTIRVFISWGALVGVDGFDVSVMPGDVFVEEYPVAAQDRPSLQHDPARGGGRVQLGRGGDRRGDLPLLLESGHAPAHHLRAGDADEHANEPFLHSWNAPGPTELFPPRRVLQRDLVGAHRVPQRLPGDALPTARQDPGDVAEGLGAGEAVVRGNGHSVEADVRVIRGPAGLLPVIGRAS
jgi:hypothetical protein